MKRLALIALVCLPLACASQRPGTNKSTATPGRGEIKLTVTPNPVVATNAGFRESDRETPAQAQAFRGCP